MATELARESDRLVVAPRSKVLPLRRRLGNELGGHLLAAVHRSLIATTSSS